jgi:glutathione S-transferase
MKLYHSFGMNPRLVRMFLAEKGIDVPRVPVDLLAGENRQAPFLAKNPSGQLPVLELDDGRYIAESVAICEYLEEQHPDKPLIGATPEDRAVARMWWRRVELEICRPMIHAFYYGEGLDLFKTRVHCLPEASAGLKDKARKAMEWLEGLLGDGGYIVGDRFSVADICLFTYVDQLRSVGQGIDPKLERLSAWFERVSQRPSAEASLWPEQPMGMRG